MKRFLLIAALASPAAAQERSYTVTVTQSQLSVIGLALGEQPYNKSAPIIHSLTAQIEAQNRPPAAPIATDGNPPPKAKPEPAPTKEGE